mgnify:CR=1 FL=1
MCDLTFFSLALPTPCFGELRPIRTPSERSRARSLDDLSKSSQGDERQHQHHEVGEEGNHHHPQLGSDNGLDKLMDWQAPYTSRPRLAPKSLRWGSQRPASEAASRQHDQYEDDDQHNEVTLIVLPSC